MRDADCCCASVAALCVQLTALTGKPKPTARRPATAKKQPLTKQIRTWVKENQVQVVVAVVVLIFLILGIIMAMPV